MVGQETEERTHLHGLDLELKRCVLVCDDHGVWVHLEAGESPHVVDAAFDALLQCERFMGASDDDEDLTGLRLLSIRLHERVKAPRTHIEYSLNANSQRHLRHLVHIIAKEPRIGQDCVVRERLHSCAAFQA